MKTVITILMAMALSVAAMVPTSAQPPPVQPSAPSPSLGPWIVGGVFIVALSVIARAAAVNAYENRQLTTAEATQAFTLPFLWVIVWEEKERRKAEKLRRAVENRQLTTAEATQAISLPFLWVFVSEERERRKKERLRRALRKLQLDNIDPFEELWTLPWFNPAR